MDVRAEHPASVYEPPILAEIGAFADLTRGDPEGPDEEEFDYYCIVC
ncbi:MAG: lasso RiPP family leader peptide-containing protein [Egibacteraceae bacterium]